MRRFFIDPATVSDATATITGDEAHHICDVLRLKPGTAVELFDGNGNIHQARIQQIGKGRVDVAILATHKDSGSASRLAIGVALLTGKKMDLVIQKATELGVDAVYPYVSRHCSIKEKNANKEERWQRIIMEACKQCNRPTAPECAPVCDFSDLLATGATYSDRIIFWEQERTRTLQDLFPAAAPPRGATLALFGPEGGFSNDEISRAVAAGFAPTSLGSRILRAETAVIGGSSILQFLLGNLHSTPR